MESSSEQKWFGSLSKDEQIRLAPSYISVLQQQLAQAEIRFRRAMDCLDYFDQILGRIKNASRVCRNCLQLSKKEEIWKCLGCGAWGCVKCNTSTKKVIPCWFCNLNACERCDPSVLQEIPEEETRICFGCVIVTDIINICNSTMTKLQWGEITRSKAVVTYLITGHNEEDELLTKKYVKEILTTYLNQQDYGWFCLDEGDKGGGIEDFPDVFEDNTFLLIPFYQESPWSKALIKEIADRFALVPDRELFMAELWDTLSLGHNLERITLTVEEFLEPFLVTDHQIITDQKWAEVGASHPEFFEKIFD